ncbi:hypothetical protein B0H63DRAFT_520498 [Podospora didyma]|uniref:Uncharacterized protein n=1 Tax=Podospora didyma TaxID=330526 RepID=A0AAE0P160_9PEZI|nr:hypothetical protein B0H63DRAFT_520498 [Podospora didyma]
MSLITASQITLRTRCANPIPQASRWLPPPWAQQQRRAIRFGRMWTSYLDPELQRDFCRRHRSPNKYGETPKTRATWEWDNVLSAYQPQDSLHSELKHAISQQESFANARNEDTPQPIAKGSRRRTPDNPDGVRPGQSIEDAERAPLEDLLFGHKGNHWSPRVTRRKHWWTPKPNNSLTDSLAEKVDNAAAVGAASDGYIDPITNRRVHKSSLDTAYTTPDGGVEPSASSFKSYRSQFSPLSPPKIEAAPQETSSIPLSEPSREPVLESDGYVANHSNPLLDALVSNHKDVSWHHSDGIKQSAGSTSAPSWQLGSKAPEFADLDRYRPAVNSKHQSHAEATAQGYEDLDRYTSVRSREPDGTYNSAAKSTVNKQELGDYQAYLNHEPNGKYHASYDEAPAQEELDEYRKPFFSHEPNGKYAANTTPLPRDKADLAKYQQGFRSHEPDGKYASRNAMFANDTADLESYGAFRSHEPNGKYAVTDAVLRAEISDAESYTAFRSHEPDGKYAKAGFSLTSEPSDLWQYQAVRSHNPDSKYTAQVESPSETPDLGNHEAFGYEDSETQCSPPANTPAEEPEYEAVRYNEPDGKPASEGSKNDFDPPELSQYRAIRWNEPDGKPISQQKEYPSNSSLGGEPSGETEEESNEYRQMLDRLMARSAAESDEASTQPQPQQAVMAEAAAAVSEDVKCLQPALDRLNETQQQDTGKSPAVPIADEPETDMAGSVDEQETPSVDTTSGTATPRETTTIYKILAYDQTVQCVDIAETTSIVPDSTAPLTPAEVLLRISNPSKFFPHFAPLQAQGFEIVSGSGDVLIFRKVRSTAEATATPPPASQPVHAINPIDMMGSVRDTPRDFSGAAGRFASPTGFVNYNLPPPNVAPVAPPPRLDSKIDVRREEPVFSGPKADHFETGENNTKNLSLAKRVLVGAVWMAGISYSLGVVGEYFKTGGSNGKGPKGF